MLITPYDVLVPQGTPAILEVEIENPWMAFIDPPMMGVEVELEGFGKARTGNRGIATFNLGSLPVGTHRPEARLGTKSVEAVVRVIPRETPVIIIDIDETIADVTPWAFIFRRVRDVRTMPGAREVLQELSKSLQIVYLTARDHIFTRKTKIWLRFAGMPEGPVYLRKGTRYWRTPSRVHKTQRLGELKPQFPNLRWGVGDKAGDAVAYAANGIRPIMIAPRRPEEVSSGVPCFPSWKNILEYIRRS